MSLFMKLDCPHCLTAGAAHAVVAISELKATILAKKKSLDAVGSCPLCGRLSIGHFVDAQSIGGFDLQHKCEGDLSGYFTVQGHPGTAQFVGQTPEIPKPNIPSHLPINVERAFLDAEKTFTVGLWGPAAAGYRKAVDRAITPLVGAGGTGKMLGPKIGMLERTNLLPPAMLDWIRIVKDDGNFALHDDDRDFDSREQVEPAREFAHTLLTYLYTLPRKVQLARGEEPSPTNPPP